MKKVIFALLVAPVAFAAVAQTPVAPNVTIADSTGNRPAVAAIVIPPIPSTQQIEDVAKAAAPMPKPWPAYFLGQTKNFTRCFGWYCAPGFVKIENDGTISTAFHAGGGSYSQVLVNYIPTWNQVVSGTHAVDFMTFGGNTQTITVGPTGITISNQIPTGWEVKVTNHTYDYSP